MGKTELITETEEAIKEAGQTLSDIVFIGSDDGYSCDWKQFKKLAEQDDQNYYGGFGGQSLATDLVIVFKDGTYLSRGEYDGSEWWEHNKPFVIPEKTIPIKTIANGDSWASLAQMHKPGGKYS